MDGEDDIEVMESCYLTCSLCGQFTSQALHLCTSDYTQEIPPGLCVNLCRNCVKRVVAKLPKEWM